MQLLGSQHSSLFTHTASVRLKWLSTTLHIKYKILLLVLNTQHWPCLQIYLRLYVQTLLFCISRLLYSTQSFVPSTGIVLAQYRSFAVTGMTSLPFHKLRLFLVFLPHPLALNVSFHPGLLN